MTQGGATWRKKLVRTSAWLRWCGMALVAAGPLIVAASLLHPSRETAATIIASESRLVAAHVLFTLYGVLVMLGLPGLYAAHRADMGRLGLTGFLVAMLGTYLIAVTGYFGFLAPVLARKAPATLDTTIQYPPVVVSSGVAATERRNPRLDHQAVLRPTASLQNPRPGRGSPSWRKPGVLGHRMARLHTRSSPR